LNNLSLCFAAVSYQAQADHREARRPALLVSGVNRSESSRCRIGLPPRESNCRATIVAGGDGPRTAVLHLRFPQR